MRMVFAILAAFLAVCLSLLVLTLVRDLRHLRSIPSLERSNPTSTALMEQRAREARRKGRPFNPRRQFVPYASISPHLKHAVLVAEDAAFFSHSGVDFAEVREAVKADWRKKRFARGASTITMQLCKNLYLSAAKTPARKLSEFILARRMDDVLSKARIFELYLNYIEWGDGIFGCQAAALSYFGCPSSELNLEQSVRLASIIVNPRRWGPFTDSRRMAGRRAWIARRLLAAGHISAAECDSLLLRVQAPGSIKSSFDDGQPAAGPAVLPREIDSGAGLPDGNADTVAPAHHPARDVVEDIVPGPAEPQPR